MSTNSHRGDTQITVGQETYTLCYDLNACALVMDQLGLSRFEELAERTQDTGMGLSDIRYIMWAGLQRHHPELTVNEVGAIEWDLVEVGSILAEAFQRGLLRESPPDIEKKVTRQKKTGTGKRHKSERTKQESQARTSSGN